MNNNNIISIITTPDGNIVNDSGANHHSLLANDNIDLKNSDMLQLCYNSKKLILNKSNHNYIVYKFPLQIKNKPYSQYIFEEWRMINQQSSNKSTNIKIFKHLKNIKNFTNHEQEVIYCLLSGYIQDKEIINYLSSYNLNSIPCVKYIIKTLYDKFETNSRTSLIQSLKAHDLDKYIPKTLFAPGIYDSLNILGNQLSHSDKIRTAC